MHLSPPRASEDLTGQCARCTLFHIALNTEIFGASSSIYIRSHILTATRSLQKIVLNDYHVAVLTVGNSLHQYEKYTTYFPSSDSRQIERRNKKKIWTASLRTKKKTLENVFR